MTPIYGLTSDNEKKTARDRRALPSIVVYDPQLLVTLPPAVVGPSGLNALAHCAEALWAANADPVTDAIALDGASRIHQHLTTAYSTEDPLHEVMSSSRPAWPASRSALSAPACTTRCVTCSEGCSTPPTPRRTPSCCPT